MKFKFLFAMALAVVCIAGSAQAAGAAATLNVTSDSKVANTATALTLNSALTGVLNDKKQYGATFTLPNDLAPSYAAYGTADQRCSGASVQAVSTGLTPTARSFDVSQCQDPAAAKVGTATLGSSSGSIYLVNTTPMPSFGIWFDTGVSPAYGRAIDVNWTGSSATLRVFGLKNASTNGLTLTFNNPARPSGLPTKFWNWPSSSSSTCKPAMSFTGTAYTYPLFGGTAATVANMAAKSVAIRGCGLGYKITTSSKVPGAKTTLTAQTTVSGTGNDAKLFGAMMHLPGNVHIAFDSYGDSSTQMCPASNFTANPTGMTPGTRAFTPANCPAAAKIGTATLGTATGTIYNVSQSPMPFQAVYFDQGVTTPYGRQINPIYDSNGYLTLMIMGLENKTSTGLTLTYNNASRPGLPAQVFENAQASDPQCSANTASAEAYTWPASGTVADLVTGLYSGNLLNGCV